jgi:serine/threonine protein kinase
VIRSLAYNDQVQELYEGAIIDDTYRLLELIGRGGMGEVWSAQHMRVSRRVAIKVLAGGLDAEWLTRFRREVEVTSRLGHPNIVEVLDTNALPSGRPYYVMGLLEGESLRSRLRRGKLALDVALALLRQIASGLHAAHVAGVVHRDLKPENIFLARETSDFGETVEVIKLLDFGIAKLVRADEHITAGDRVLGTTPYLAPEQASGNWAFLGPRSDQFALASVVFEMVSGERLFAAKSDWEIRHQIVNERPPRLNRLLSEIPRPFFRALEQALEKNPDARHADVAAFYRALTRRDGDVTERQSQKAAPPLRESAGEDLTEPSTAVAQQTARPREPSLAGVIETSPARTFPRGRNRDRSPAILPTTRRSVSPDGEQSPPMASLQQAPPRKRRGCAALCVALVGVAVLVLAGSLIFRQRQRDPKPLGGRSSASGVAAGNKPRADAGPDRRVPNRRVPNRRVPNRRVPNRRVPDRRDRRAANRQPEKASQQAGDTRQASERPIKRAAVTKQIQAAIKSTTRPRKIASIDPAAARQLDAAKKALSRKDYGAALQSAQRALQFGSRPAVFAVMARAYCGLRNFGMVKAMLRNLPPSARPAVKRDCRRLGVKLD